MRTLVPLALTAVLVQASLAVAAPAAIDESGALRGEIEALKQGQQAILKDLQEIKKLLAERAVPPAKQEAIEKTNATVAVGGIPPKGNPGAAVTLIEFSDYQCPFCGRHVQQTAPEILKEYVDTGKLRYVFRDFPLEAIHPQAFKAAEAARCAGDQGKYWEMHDMLFANQRELQPEKLAGYAAALGLATDAFQACLEQGKYSAAIKRDQEDGTKLGVRGTPTVAVGMSEGDQAKNVVVIRGAQPFASFKTELDKLLAPPAEKK